jgi:hypothetical protein
VAILVTLGCRLRQLHPSDILAAANALRRGSTSRLSVRRSRSPTLEYSKPLRVPHTMLGVSRFCWLHDTLVTVTVVVEVVFVLPIETKLAVAPSELASCRLTQQ